MKTRASSPKVTKPTTHVTTAQPEKPAAMGKRPSSTTHASTFSGTRTSTAERARHEQSVQADASRAATSAQRASGAIYGAINDKLIPAPPFPTPQQLKSKTEPGAAMPAEAVAYVKKMMMGDMHARWHTTRDFKFTMAELPASAPASSPTGQLNAAWNALRAAGQGLPAPKPQKGDPPLTPQQQAFVTAMNAFCAANPKSKDSATQDVVQTWQEVQKQNWPIPAREEGDPGNGLDFLAMHHDMIGDMKKHCANDPVAMAALNGWAQLPTPQPWPYDPKDSTAGVAKATTAVNLLNEMMATSDPGSITKFKTDFKQVTGLDFDNTSPDQYGLWIQSSAGGLPNSGIHNWMHNQYEVPGSPIEMDSFNQNVQNQHFWGLHGFIEGSFMKFLELRNIPLSTLQPVFDEQEKEMGMGHMVMGGTKGVGAGMDKGLAAVIQRAQDGVRERGLMK
jgi:hypothetical protein